MSAGQWIALAFGAAAIVGTFYLITDIDEFCDGLTDWSDDEKAADHSAGGVGAEIERPSEHNT